MADTVEVKVDATRALAKMDRIPVAVRDQLRSIIPDLTKQLGALVNAKIASELASHKTLNVAQEMHENAQRIIGVVRLDANSPSPSLLPLWLEEGTKEHFVAPVRAKALHWTEGGQDFFSKGHWVRGIGPYKFLARSFNEMKDQIVTGIKNAVKTGARQANAG